MKQSRWRISSGRGPFPIWSEPQALQHNDQDVLAVMQGGLKA
jgi:hypothetical protein